MKAGLGHARSAERGAANDLQGSMDDDRGAVPAFVAHQALCASAGLLGRMSCPCSGPNEYLR